MEFLSWNPMRLIRHLRQRRQRQPEGARAVWNPMRIIRQRQQRRQQRREQLQEQLREQLRRQEEEESRTVEISHPRTRIRGVIGKSIRHPPLQYIAFLGIPYAQSPVGELRFQPPQALPQPPPDRPTELFPADNGSHPCTQRNESNEITGSEDCLYLNVFTPRKPKDIPELLPVLVYIHGGGFIVGENLDPDPQNLIRENMIVVFINYRLSIFGFLNMRTQNCLGNAGMKDQVMALQWVQKNIKHFKGNPENVTICGHSAGGSCVNLHMLSPLSKGYFHKAIVMAGGVYCPWGFGGHAKHITQLFKDATKKSNELRFAVVESLKEMKTNDLFIMGEKTMNEHITKLEPRKMTALFKPSVECVRDGAFLPDPVEKLMEEATPVPTIAGITKQEGYQYFRSEDRDGNVTTWQDPTAVKRHFQSFKTIYFPEEGILEGREDVKEEEKYKLVPTREKLRRDEEKRYIEEEQKQRLATLFTDIIFRRFYENFKIGNLLNGGGPPFYVYEFDYFAGQPLFPMKTLNDDHHDNQPLVNPRAADHGDDYCFLFAPELVDTVVKRIAGEEDRKRVRSEIESVQINMSSLWSSFCRTEHPRSRVEDDANVFWRRYTERFPYYLRIGKELNLKYGRLNKERWPALNSICQLEPTIPSLAVTPQTPKEEFAEFQLSQPEFGSSSTQAPDIDGEAFQLPRHIPDSSTSQTPGTEYEISHLSQPEPDQSTSQTSVEEVEYECTRL